MRQKSTKYVFAVAAAILALGPVASSRAAAQSAGRFEYAVKFVCGNNIVAPRSPAAAMGAYFTAINVHNPSNDDVAFVHKVALAVAGRPVRHTPLVAPFRIGSDDATDVDCLQIARDLASAGIPVPPFYTGFFVIQSTAELDVVAVYTAAPSRGQPVTTMSTERVPARVRGAP